MPDQIWMSVALDHLVQAATGATPSARIDRLRPASVPVAFAEEALPLIAEGFTDRSWNVEELSRQVLNPDTLQWLITAREDEHLVGITTVHLTAEPSVVRLHWLAVAATHRRAGLGTALVDAAARSALEDGFAVMKLKTETYRTDAIGLYERLGFTTVPG